MKEITTQTAYLLSTLRYYTKKTAARRCTLLNPVGMSLGCFYSPKNADKPNSQGCAIGRFMTPAEQIEADKGLDGQTGVKYLGNKLPTRFKVLGMDFLEEIQALHDTSANWLEEGLSDSGKEHVSYIVNKFKLDRKTFKRYLPLKQGSNHTH